MLTLPASLSPAVASAVNLLGGAREWTANGATLSCPVGASRHASAIDALADLGWSFTGGADDEMAHPAGHVAHFAPTGRLIVTPKAGA